MARLADKNQLIDAAARLFRHKGYSATSIGEIVQACGITKGSLYHHFESKEALAVATIERVHDYFNRNIFALLSQSGQPGARELEAFNDAVEAFFTAHPDGCLLANLSLEVGSACEPFRSRIQAFFQDWCDCYARVFSDYMPQEQAVIRAQDAVAIVHGCILMNRISGSLDSLRRQHASMLALCRR